MVDVRDYFNQKKKVEKKEKVEKKVEKKEVKQAERLEVKDVLREIPSAEVEPGETFRAFFPDYMTTDYANASQYTHNCLANITLVFHGTYNTILPDLAVKLGARVTKAPSSKTTFAVIADGTSALKIKKLLDLDKKIIEETGFVDLLKRFKLDEKVQGHGSLVPDIDVDMDSDFSDLDDDIVMIDTENKNGKKNENVNLGSKVGSTNVVGSNKGNLKSEENNNVEIIDLDSEGDSNEGDSKKAVGSKIATNVVSNKRTADSTSQESHLIDDEEPEPVKKKAKVSASPVKPAKSPVKNAKSPVKTSKSASKPTSGVTADEILKTIPDAELPEVDDSKPFNFFANKKSEGDDNPVSLVDIGEAQPNCLSGLTIVFTGVLPNLDRTASENLAKRYGAKVTKSISGSTSLVVLGDDAGPSKVKKIKEKKIKAINEDGFIKLLQSMPAEGGDGEAAQKATLKREAEERKVMEDIERQEREEEEKLKKQKLREKEALKASQEAVKSDPNRKPAEVEREISNDEKLWTVKYAPTDPNQLCGNKGVIANLEKWLASWFDNVKSGNSSFRRAALISGPPGIGKTSAAHIIAKKLGFDVLEKNASDVRSKSLLNSSIKSVLNNTSVVGFFNKSSEKNKQKFVLIMDEVDGMSSGDRGGAGALSAFCKITKMPIILICNDKTLPKMRTFDTVTLGLPFRRPSEQEVRARLMMIAHREKIKLDPSIIGQLVQATGNDIRQMINLLSTVSKTQKVIGSEQANDASKAWKKQTLLKPFDIAGKMLNGQMYLPSARHSLNDKIDLYFNDMDFTPLMIQENYISTTPSNCKNSIHHLQKVANAADDISQSDRINSLIRSSQQQWSLLPFHAVMSSVKPSQEVAGNLNGMMRFSSWLGKNSSGMKYQRLLQEIQYHTRLRTSTSKTELRLDYLSVLIDKLTKPMIELGDEGIGKVIEVMDYYYLTREDWDYIIDFGVGECDDIIKKIPGPIKTAFTKKYNSMTHPIAIYKTGNSVGSGGGGTKKETVDYDGVVEDDTAKDDAEEVGDNDTLDLKKDKLIKMAKPKKKAVKKAPKKKA